MLPPGNEDRPRTPVRMRLQLNKLADFDSHGQASCPPLGAGRLRPGKTPRAELVPAPRPVDSPTASGEESEKQGSIDVTDDALTIRGERREEREEERGDTTGMSAPKARSIAAFRSPKGRTSTEPTLASRTACSR